VARIPSPALHSLWRGRIRRQADSGLTIARFCAREHLSPASFSAWKRRLRLIDLADHRPTSATSPAFLPVTVRIPDRPTGDALAIEASLPNGVRLRIPTSNADLACRLVRVVARAIPENGGSKC
jgi:hypothetical protein